MPWGFAAAAVGSVAAGAISSSASKGAANTQANAANNATDLQSKIFDTSQQNFAPYLSAGADAQGKLSQLLGIGTPGAVAQTQDNFDPQAYLAANPDVAAYIAANPGQTNAWQHYNDFGKNEGRSFTPTAAATAAYKSAPGSGSGSFGSLTSPFTIADFQANQDPGYGFQLQQGLQSQQNQGAAGSGAASGSALKGLLSYSQGLANSTYNDAFNRYQTQNQNIYNRLSGVASLGQASAAGSAANATNAGANIANTVTSGAAATAAGQVGSANALSSGINGAGSAATLASLLNKNSAGGTTLGGGSSDPLGDLLAGGAFGGGSGP